MKSTSLTIITSCNLWLLQLNKLREDVRGGVDSCCCWLSVVNGEWWMVNIQWTFTSLVADWWWWISPESVQSAEMIDGKDAMESPLLSGVRWVAVLLQPHCQSGRGINHGWVDFRCGARCERVWSYESGSHDVTKKREIKNNLNSLIRKILLFWNIYLSLLRVTQLFIK
jgi:hypothetical protein